VPDACNSPRSGCLGFEVVLVPWFFFCGDALYLSVFSFGDPALSVAHLALVLYNSAGDLSENESVHFFEMPTFAHVGPL